jgi:predicted Fe-Mo cluster-binding NifX family protein
MKVGSVTNFILVILGMAVAAAQEAPAPRVAVASMEKSVESTVSLRAARSPYFIIFVGSEYVEAVENPNKNVGSGAGPEAAEWLAQKQIDIVVGGMIGEKMRAALEEKKISYIEFKGTVEEGLQKALATKTKKTKP